MSKKNGKQVKSKEPRLVFVDPSSLDGCLLVGESYYDSGHFFGVAVGGQYRLGDRPSRDLGDVTVAEAVNTGDLSDQDYTVQVVGKRY